MWKIGVACRDLHSTNSRASRSYQWVRMVDCLVGVLNYHWIHHLMKVEESVSIQGTFHPQEATFHVLWNSCKVRLKFSCTRMHSIRRSDASQKQRPGNA